MTAGQDHRLLPRQKKAKPLKRRVTEGAEEQGMQAESDNGNQFMWGLIAA